jgi:hypothetical protein
MRRDRPGPASRRVPQPDLEATMPGSAENQAEALKATDLILEIAARGDKHPAAGEQGAQQMCGLDLTRTFLNSPCA